MENQTNQAINLGHKLSSINKHWTPGIIAAMNDYHFKLAKIQGEFIWHDHEDTDEAFFVVEGSMRIELKDQDTVYLNAGELYVVPKGVQHKPVAEQECSILLIEPSKTVNTGDEDSDRKVSPDWL